MVYVKISQRFNPSTTITIIVGFTFFCYHINYHLLNMLEIKCNTNQQDFNIVNLYLGKSE